MMIRVGADSKELGLNASFYHLLSFLCARREGGGGGGAVLAVAMAARQVLRHDHVGVHAGVADVSARRYLALPKPLLRLRGVVDGAPQTVGYFERSPRRLGAFDHLVLVGGPVREPSVGDHLPEARRLPLPPFGPRRVIVLRLGRKCVPVLRLVLGCAVISRFSLDFRIARRSSRVDCCAFGGEIYCSVTRDKTGIAGNPHIGAVANQALVSGLATTFVVVILPDALMVNTRHSHHL
mmetsp:Transcript_21939/g.36618  ORF Transcript_21939/g.36618 Transcript_21939/m.36618 type:complete len:237 (-) Transcript_21939:238-948(-)